MLTKDDCLLMAEILATANGHPAPADYANAVGDAYDHKQDVANALPPAATLVGTQVLSDPTEWPAPVVEVVINPSPDADSGL
jgi:hypothetical protein